MSDDVLDIGQDQRPAIVLYALTPMHLGPNKEVGYGDKFITRDQKTADYMIAKERASKEPAPTLAPAEEASKAADDPASQSKTAQAKAAGNAA